MKLKLGIGAAVFLFLITSASAQMDYYRPTGASASDPAATPTEQGATERYILLMRAKRQLAPVAPAAYAIPPTIPSNAPNPMATLHAGEKDLIVRRITAIDGQFRNLQADVVHAGKKSVYIGSDTVGNYIKLTNTTLANNFLRFMFGTTTTNALEKMRIMANGFIGVGTTNPMANLHIHSAGTEVISGIKLTTGNTGATLTDGAGIYSTGNNLILQNFETTGQIGFVTKNNNGVNMNVLTIGDNIIPSNPGIEVNGVIKSYFIQTQGIDVPTIKTDVINASGLIYTTGDIHGKSLHGQYLRTDKIIFTDIDFGTQNNQGNFSKKMSIKNNGNVGIGTTNPQKMLDVAGAVQTNEICLPDGKNPSVKKCFKYVCPNPGGLGWILSDVLCSQLGKG